MAPDDIIKELAKDLEMNYHDKEYYFGDSKIYSSNDYVWVEDITDHDIAPIPIDKIDKVIVALLILSSRRKK